MKLSTSTFLAGLGFVASVAAQGTATSGSGSSGANPSSVPTATNHIVVSGNAFFDSVTHERFYIRGVDYQPGGSSSTTDPLANDTCTRDIPYMAKLGINTIRVYQVDNSADHSTCMQMLADNGIYLILDVNTAHQSLTRTNTADSYNAIYLQHVFATIDSFKNYDNVLGFFAGNEVVNADDNTMAGRWVKAALRDMKRYIKAQASRPIPVGYSAADVASRVELAQYFNCGDDEASRADFYAFNQYEWCGDSSFQVSGYDQRVQEFNNYSIPLFFSEYGCNEVSEAPGGGPDRPFTEVKAIYSDRMTSVYSGGLVYEFSQEDSNYGLVQINGDSVTTLKDYDTLQQQYQNTPNPTGNGSFLANGSPSNCPSNSSDFTIIIDLPPIPQAAEKYIKNGAGKPLGSDGPSNAGYGGDAQVSVAAGTAQQTATLSQGGAGASQMATGSSSSSSSSSGSGSSGSSSSTSSSSSDSAAGIVRASSISSTMLVAMSTLIVGGGFFCFWN